MGIDLLGRRGIAIVVLAILSIPIAGSNVSADGMTVYVPPDDTWRLLNEDAQFAIINHVGGYEDLLLQISVPYNEVGNASSLLWLFPIPASPTNTTIGIVENFPAFGGHFLSDYAKFAVTEDFAMIYSTQIYPIPFALSSLYTVGEIGPTRTLIPRNDEGGLNSTPGVNVFQQIEQSGLSTELIGTGNAFALNDYLSAFGVDLPESSLPIIQDYADEGYSFVASRVADIPLFRASSTVSYGPAGKVFGMSVEIWFPSERIYYPMRLTSVYGNSAIPIVLEIMDYVTPARTDASSKLPLEYYYCLDPTYRIGDNLEWFFPEQETSGQLHNGVISDLEFTLVFVYAEADQMTYDLYFENHPSSSAAIDDFMMDHGWVVLIPLFFGLSMTASLLAGSLVYRGYEPKRRKFALLGLANGTTIVGFALITRRLRIDADFVSSEGLVGQRWKRFVGSFSLIFVALSFLCHLFINIIVL